jgi:hypothetical protein
MRAQYGLVGIADFAFRSDEPRRLITHSGLSCAIRSRRS